jgi:hypothetical protein
VRFPPVPQHALELTRQLHVTLLQGGESSSGGPLGDASCDKISLGLVGLSQSLQEQTEHYDGNEDPDVVKGLLDLVGLASQLEQLSIAAQSTCRVKVSAETRARILVATSFVHAAVLADFYTLTNDDAALFRSTITAISQLTDLASIIAGLKNPCNYFSANQASPFEMFAVFCSSSLTTKALVLRRRTALWELAIALRPNDAAPRLHYAVSLVLGMGRTSSQSRETLAKEIEKAPHRLHADYHHGNLLNLLLLHCLHSDGQSAPGNLVKVVQAQWPALARGECQVLADIISPGERAAFKAVWQIERPSLFTDRAELRALVETAEKKLFPEAGDKLRRCFQLGLPDSV